VGDYCPCGRTAYIFAFWHKERAKGVEEPASEEEFFFGRAHEAGLPGGISNCSVGFEPIASLQESSIPCTASGYAHFAFQNAPGCRKIVLPRLDLRGSDDLPPSFTSRILTLCFWRNDIS